jgi:hypothetical protein
MARVIAQIDGRSLDPPVLVHRLTEKNDNSRPLTIGDFIIMPFALLAYSQQDGLLRSSFERELPP